MIQLIPAIDIMDGKCVRLSQGDYDKKKVYGEDPVEVALQLEDHGITRLHVVDLDGAASHHIVNHRTLHAIATRTKLVIDFGGGVKSDEDLQVAFDNGAQMVTGGSIAVSAPQRFEAWLQQYGAERIILGADVRERRIAVNGWREETAQPLMPFLAHYVERGIRQVICTDIGCDGMLQGPSVELYRDILTAHPDLLLVASGGVSSMDDIRTLQEAGVPAVIFGKALYEGRITLQELERYIVQQQ